MAGVTEDRNWRDAKIPQWAKDAIEAEAKALRLCAALAWPQEARPVPLPFGWWEYDRLSGTPVAGRYWGIAGGVNGYCVHVDVALIGASWRSAQDGRPFSAYSIHRGHLFATKREALLHMLWTACDDAARKLMNAREAVDGTN